MVLYLVVVYGYLEVVEELVSVDVIDLFDE